MPISKRFLRSRKEEGLRFLARALQRLENPSQFAFPPRFAPHRTTRLRRAAPFPPTRRMDNIHVDPHPQFMPLVRPAPSGTLPDKPETPAPSRTARPRRGRQQAQQPAQQPPVDGQAQPPPLTREEQEQRRAAREERRRIALAEQQEQLRQREVLRLAAIEQWAPVVEQERRKCEQWLASDNQSANSRTADEIVGMQIESFWKETRPSPNRMQAHHDALQNLQAFFDANWPGCQLTVAPFGSSVTGMVHDGSDIDVILLDPSRPMGPETPFDKVVPIGPQQNPMELPDFYNIRKVGKALRRYRTSTGRLPFHHVEDIARARVPIVKCQTGDGIPVDISINVRFGLFNSHIIRAYADLRPQLLRPLCFAVKHWLKRRDLNDPSGSAGPPSLSSYAIVLHVIQYLQVHHELPTLQNWELLQQFELQEEVQYWSPSSRPRRERGQALASQGKPQECNVTFFDPASKPAWMKEVVRDGRRCWINERIYDVDKLPAFDVWDQVAQDDMYGKLGLPDSSAVGMHKVDDANVPAMLGYHFRRFIEWYYALDKAKSVVSVRDGRVKHLHTRKERNAFLKAFRRTYGEGAESSEAGQLDEESGVDGEATQLAAKERGQDGDGEVNQPIANKGKDKASKSPHPASPTDAEADYRTVLSFDTTQPEEWTDKRFITQDPFIISRNVTGNVKGKVADAIDAEFHRAMMLLRGGEAATSLHTVFADLCQPASYTTALATKPLVVAGAGQVAESNDGKSSNAGQKKKGKGKGKAPVAAVEQGGTQKVDERPPNV